MAFGVLKIEQNFDTRYYIRRLRDLIKKKETNLLIPPPPPPSSRRRRRRADKGLIHERDQAK